jgi:hypothetical protein
MVSLRCALHPSFCCCSCTGYLDTWDASVADRPAFLFCVESSYTRQVTHAMFKFRVLGFRVRV